MKQPEDYLRKHCEVIKSQITGEDLIMSPLSIVLEAFKEYAKDLKASSDYDDFGFGDPSGDSPDTCSGGICNTRRLDKSI